MPGKILLVDDGPRERELLVEAAKGIGRDLELATSKEDAIAKMSKEQFDVVVTDLEMDHNPRAGFSVLSAALEKDPATPVIVITAFGDKPKCVEAMEAGAFDYIERNSPGTDTHEMLRCKIKWALKVRDLQRRAAEDMPGDDFPEVCIQGDNEKSTHVNAWFPAYPNIDASLPVGISTKLNVNIGSRIKSAMAAVHREQGLRNAQWLGELDTVDILIVCAAAVVRPLRRTMRMPPGPNATVEFDLSPRRGGVSFLRVVLLDRGDEIHRCDFAFAAHAVRVPEGELVAR